MNSHVCLRSVGEGERKKRKKAVVVKTLVAAVTHHHWSLSFNLTSWTNASLNKLPANPACTSPGTRVITCGVPQGSILGPSLFTLHIHINSLSAISVNWSQQHFPYWYSSQLTFWHLKLDVTTFSATKLRSQYEYGWVWPQQAIIFTTDWYARYFLC